MGLTDAGQARYRQIRGALDEITTRLVEAADKLLVGPGKVKTAALVPVFLPGRPPGGESFCPGIAKSTPPGLTRKDED